jgi:hypothetical protein
MCHRGREALQVHRGVEVGRSLYGLSAWPEKADPRKERAMSRECDLLEKCGFFKKYQPTRDLACRGFIQQYCRGPKMNECKRKQYRRNHGISPSDDMMPNGQTMAEG